MRINGVPGVIIKLALVGRTNVPEKIEIMGVPIVMIKLVAGGTINRGVVTNGIPPVIVKLAAGGCTVTEGISYAKVNIGLVVASAVKVLPLVAVTLAPPESRR